MIVAGTRNGKNGGEKLLAYLPPASFIGLLLLLLSSLVVVVVLRYL